VPQSAKARVVQAALIAKGMVPDESHHHMLRKKIDGVTELVTRISHNSSDIQRSLATLMAHQCALTTNEFWRLIECPLTEREWNRLVKDRCAGGRNPFIGQ
jgi:hypothetical protein